jgi:hypothetical protein
MEVTTGKEKPEKEVEKNILDVLNDQLGKGTLSDFSEYTQNTQNYGHMPDNQFGHAWNLINVRRGEPKDFEDLLNPHIFLGELRLTGALDGSERVYQAFKTPMARSKGFSILKKKKKKREPIDYVLPDEDDEGIY